MITEYEVHMRTALALAEGGRGWVSPNPVVGAVVMFEGREIARGFHREFGGPHAEIQALKRAGADARGATLYMTLEPCCHQGKTPPCTDAIIKAGIRRVVLGARDPNPKAAGGAEILRQAGIEVVEGILERECREQNAPFFKFQRTGLPLITVKWAMTADGKIADARGDSKWITAPPARAFAHELRATNDAVLIGSGTLLRDAPLLTARMCNPNWHKFAAVAATGGRDVPPPAPLKPSRRVILDSQARTPLNAPIWTAENGGPIVIAVTDIAPKERVQALEDKGAEVLRFTADAHGRVPVKELALLLAKNGILALFVEGGAEALGSFIDEGLADRAFVFIAPKIVGGRESLSAVGGRGVVSLSESRPLRDIAFRRLGDDVLLEGRMGDWSWLKSVGAHLY
jgi:diaminohydroxyphosphoribosylaminopyrimidine deaminase/5-amino-6-(5-phosphoribosylamino)uracil reductase